MSGRHSVDLKDLFPREVDVEICSKTLKIYQKSEGDVSCVVWDAAIVLAKYLEIIAQSMPNFLSELKILELGSGLGLVGLTAATLGAQVTLTDLPETLPLLRTNINENKNDIVSVGGYATVEALVWGDVKSDILQSMAFDYVLIADCIYYEESIDPLIRTLLHLNVSSNKKPIILISQEMRDSQTQKKLWNEFFKKLTCDFDIEKIPEEKQHPEFRSYDIILLKAVKKY